MVGRPLSVHDLGQQQLLEGVAVLKHAALPQAGLEGWHIVPVSHAHLVERVAVFSGSVLDDHVTVDEVGAYPRGVKGRPGAIQEHYTDDVIANVSFLVDLEREMG